jgi:hypothetical protein
VEKSWWSGPRLFSRWRYRESIGGTFLRRAVEILPNFADKRQAVEISQQIEADISAYLLTITAMNAAVGTGCIHWKALGHILGG